jgi:hypothetical protein
MIESRQNKSRRRFIEDGLRTVALSGLACMGFVLGRRKASSPAQKKSCDVDLPCRICSKLPGCQLSEALDAKRKYK